MNNEKMTISEWCIKLNVRPAMNNDDLYNDKKLYNINEFYEKVPYDTQVALCNETFESRNKDLTIQKIKEVVALEEKLVMLKEIETEIKQQKEDLRQAMIAVDMKKWEMPNGTKITLIEDAPDEEVEIKKIDEVKFAEENLEFHNAFMEHKKQYEARRDEYATIEKQIKAGRKGYVRITLPKAEA